MISRQQVCEYNAFSNPYTGLAAMILYQADYDLRTLGEKEHYSVWGDNISKSEIKRFFNSRWAAVLASNCGVSEVDLARYAQRV